MKRILSIFLCVAMLASMASMTVYGVEYGTQSDQVTTKNVMTFTTDKETYAPGDTVAIKVAMESIWGDPDLVDYIEGYEDQTMAGAYGMNILCSTLIYDKTVFTAQKHTDLLPTSTIANAQANDVSLEGNNPIEAKTNGAYYLMAVSDTFNADYDGYGFFTGSGDLYQYNFTIAADAAPGTYYLPVGPYVITDEETGASIGKPPVIKFADDKEGRVWSWLGNPDSYFVDQPVEYKTNYTGGSRVSADYPDGAKYECSYVVITIEGDGPVDPPIPPEPVDPMAVELVSDKEGTALIPGDTVTFSMNIKNNEGLTSPSLDLAFDNTALKLVEIASPIADFGTADVNYDNVNKLGSFDKKDEATVTEVYFTGTGSFTEDGTAATLKFEVLATAEAGDTSVKAAFIENGLDATATATIAGEHKHNFVETTTPAECTVEGKVEQICDCGLVYYINKISKLGHTTTANSQVTEVPASCEKDGYTAVLCDVCGKSASTTTIAALGHEWKTVTTELSCTTDESTQDVCQREGCGAATEIVVTAKALKHIDPETGKEAWGEPYIIRKPTTNTVGAWAKDCALCKTPWEYEDIPVLEQYLGDVNMDEKINLSDVSTLLKYIAKWEGLYFSVENADVKYDGRINIMDASHLLKYLADWDVVLGEGGTAVN